MPRFGNYEAVSELYRGGLGRVWTARGLEGVVAESAGGGGEPTFAVKTCEPNVAVVGERAASEAVRRFVEQARVQQEVSRAGGAAASAGAAGGGGVSAGAGGTHWAPVHAIVEGESSAAYVTDLFGRSAERLVTGRLRVDQRSLQRITSGVVDGLRELKEQAGRGHGNLKPSNVLLDAATDLGLARVVLTDPAPPDRVDAGTESRDVRAVGDLIHRLVLHQAFTERSAWPVAASPEWSRLGKMGGKWLELANRLLSPKPDEPKPTLDELKEEIEGLTPKRGNRGLLIAGTAAGVLILGGGVTLAVLAGGGGGNGGNGPHVNGEVFDPAAWQALNEAYLAWFGDLDRAIERLSKEGGERRAMWESDATLREVMEQLGEAKVDPKEIAQRPAMYQSWAAGGDPPESVMSGRGPGETRAALEVVEAVGTRLREAWPTLAELEAAAARWESEAFGWSHAAARAREAVEAVRSAGGAAAGEGGSGPPMPTAIDDVLATAARVRELERRWKQIESDAAVIGSKEDPVLGRFGPAAAAWIAGGEAPGSDEEALVDPARLEEVEQLAADLRRFVETKWSNFDHETFLEEHELYETVAAGGAVETSQFRPWLHAASAPQFERMKTPDPRTGWAIAARAQGTIETLGEIARELEVSVSEGEGAWGGVELAREVVKALASAGRGERYEPRLREAADLLAQARDRSVEIAVEQVRWARGTADTITGKMGEADRAMEQAELTLSDVLQRIRLDKEATFEQVRQAIAAREQISPSSAVNAAWQRGKGALLAKYQPGSGLDVRDLRDEAEALEEALKPIGEAGGALPADLERVGVVQQVEEALRKKRERAVEAALASLLGPGGELPPPDDGRYASAATQVREAVGAWVEDAVAMAGDLGAASKRLNLGYGLGEGGEESPGALYEKWEGREVFADAFAETGGPEPLAERIDGLKRVEGITSRRALAAEIEGSQQGRQERAVAAYRRLDEFPPSSVEELGSELVLAERMRLALEDVGRVDPRRREALESEFADAQRERWRAFATGSPSQAALEGALEVRGRFGVELTPQALGEQLYIDAQVFALKKGLAAAGEEDDKARLTAESFLAAIDSASPSLSRGVLEQSPAAEIVAGVRALVSGGEVEPPRVSPTTIGPGAVDGWVGAEVTDERVVFTRADGRGVRLEFVRVEGGAGVEPFYIMTTELSLGQFQAIDELGSGVATTMLGAAGSSWTGPRVWAVSQRAGVQRNTSWLQESNYTGSPYAAGLEPERPSEQMPMQYVSGAAAAYVARVVGCRLPTSAEWKTAAASSVRVEDANLRDATWKSQRDYIAPLWKSFTGLSYPDEGIFFPTGDRPPSGDEAQVWQRPDGQTLNDGTLWFRPVEEATTGEEIAVEGLVGNVAEWLFEDAAALEALDASGVEALHAQEFGDASLQLAVIGGSAMSPPELALAEAYKPFDPWVAAMMGYSDVGVRLVFPARGTGRETFGDKVAALLGESPYLTAR